MSLAAFETKRDDSHPSIGQSWRRNRERIIPFFAYPDVFIYDPVADTWEEGPSLNLPRSTLAAVSTPDGKIYAIGGTNAGAYSSTKSLINAFLSQEKEHYTGRVQDTVEVLDTKSLQKR
ncbi:MAG TPA: hypothetical protein ENN66_06210 [Proteobacteria bacterium]|nr:hypothetical protein [Pseudomonadota bacterium]